MNISRQVLGDLCISNIYDDIAHYLENRIRRKSPVFAISLYNIYQEPLIDNKV
jgi:hypothetical protein